MAGTISDLTAAVIKARAAQQASQAASKAVAAQIAASRATAAAGQAQEMPSNPAPGQAGSGSA